MKHGDFLALVGQMRKEQRAFYRANGRERAEAMERAKLLEKRVDAALAESRETPVLFEDDGFGLPD